MTDERFLALNHLQQTLSCRFIDVSLLDHALTHRSFVNENPAAACKDNERLEFLGDSLIGLCTSDMLMKKHPQHTEGDLSKMRASLVNEQVLSDVAKILTIGDYLLLGKGEEASGGRTKVSILSNAFEAITAAIYLDSGFEHAYGFLALIFEPLIEKCSTRAPYRDYKTALQEICQNRFKDIPRYRLTGESGPDHEKIFTVSLSVADHIMTKGIGKSKKEAEQEAAKRALELLQIPAAQQERDKDTRCS